MKMNLDDPYAPKAPKRAPVFRHKTRTLILNAIAANPSTVTMEELMEIGKLSESTNVWYHLRILSRCDAHPRIEEVIRRLKAEGKHNQLAQKTHKRVRKVINLTERIEAVALKACHEFHEDAQLFVRPNGVKVVALRRTHFVVVAH
jgi:hypothetical protein